LGTPVSPERVLAVIPARLASTRLPRKVLRELNGQPLLAWVVEAAARCPQVGKTVVAVDSEEVAALCQPAQIEALLRPFAEPEVAVSTLKVRCPKESIDDPNVVKVVTAPDGRALYFSRAAIPFSRDGQPTTYWKHLGLYAYRKTALTEFAALPPGQLEQIERLEQLRLLENGIAIHVAESPVDTVGVDTEEDLRRVAALLERKRVDG
jgi:3-deoxy-manno-octulosonate cytidylyltransferase (CMP-KDO synthetase)